MTATDILRDLVAGRPLSGLHVLVIGHPDDEAISCSAVLSAAPSVSILQLTDGVPGPSGSARELVADDRRIERAAAHVAGDWRPELIECRIPAREACDHFVRLAAATVGAIAGATAVWTHPYEGGHIDHDSAAWLVARACWVMGAEAPVHLEFASYHSQGLKRDTFGRFWPDPSVAIAEVHLEGSRLMRKRRALAAYLSQAAILRKFPTIAIEPYRPAPIYNFSQPPPPPACRWDRKGYQPSTAEWRRLTVTAAQRLESA